MEGPQRSGLSRQKRGRQTKGAGAVVPIGGILSRSSRHTLTTADTTCIWLKIVWPQVGFLVAVWLVQLWLGGRLSADLTRDIPILSLWCRIPVIGPFGVYCAVTSEYPTFRLEANGERIV